MVDLQPGLKIRSYTLERLLGRGASGEVWKAYDPFKTVAIKFMNETLMASANAAKHRARMEREVEALQKLQHPNIPALYDFDLDYPRPYIVMRFVGGDTYDKLISSGQMLRIPLERRIDLIREIAMALTAAHEAGIIHRDIKPANLTGIENPYLLDFSISLEQNEADATQKFVGTTLYMSPDGLADRLADNYSFTLIAYEILFGRHPLYRPTDRVFNPYVALDRLQKGEWAWPSRLAPNELPPDMKGANLTELDRIFAKGMGPRENRYGDLRDLVRDLRAAAIPAQAPAAHDEDYVPTMMMDASAFQEMIRSQPPVAPPAAPRPAPVPSPVPAPVPPAPAAEPAKPLFPSIATPPRAAEPPPAPATTEGGTQIEIRTVPYASLEKRAEHPNPPPATPDRTELDATPPAAPPPSMIGQQTELELPKPGAPAAPPAVPAAPRAPVQAAAPVPDAAFTRMEFPAAAPAQPRAPAADFTLLEMEKPAANAGSFTMMEMQAPGRDEANFTRMELRAQDVRAAARAQGRQRSRGVRVVIVLALLLLVIVVVLGVLLATGTLRLG